MKLIVAIVLMLAAFIGIGFVAILIMSAINSLKNPAKTIAFIAIVFGGIALGALLSNDSYSFKPSMWDSVRGR